MDIREAPADAATPQDGDTWELRLYVAGQTTKSVTALANLKRYCEQHLVGRYTLEVIDSPRSKLSKPDHIGPSRLGATRFEDHWRSPESALVQTSNYPFVDDGQLRKDKPCLIRGVGSDILR